MWPKGGPSTFCTDSRSAGSSAQFTCSLTALIEKGHSFIRHTLKAVETHNHLLVPFKTVTGAHGLRHLQEAADVLQPHRGVPIKGCSHVEWETESLCIHPPSSLTKQSPWLCELVATGLPTASPWSFPGRPGQNHGSLVPGRPSCPV